MPLGKRLILPTLDYSPYKHDGGTTDEEVLDGVTAAKMTGLLIQLGKLAEFATEIFTDIKADLEQSYNRIRGLNTRVTGISPTVSQRFSTLAKFRLVKRQESPLTQASFTVETRDPANKNRYLAAHPKPPFEQFSIFTKGEDVGKKYSNPQFFFDMWLQAEQARQDEAAQRKEKTRGEKKKRKKVNAEKEAKKVDVAKVVTKNYNPLGMEFGATEAPAAQMQVFRPPQTQEKRGSATNIQPMPTDLGAESNGGPPPPPPPRGSQMFASPMPGSVPAPPRQQSLIYQSPPAPPAFFHSQMPAAPPIPAAPMIPTAPMVPAAPMVSAAPMIPAPPMIPAAPGISSGGGDGGDYGSSLSPVPTSEEEEMISEPSGLLSQLTQVKLRPAAPLAPKPVDAKSSLLAQIRDVKSRSLRKVEVAKKETPAAGPLGNLSVASILARRAAIEGDSDEEEDDGWED